MTELNILIVDDDVDFADGLMELFELDGHCPVIVHSGGQAVAAARNGKFDVALVDIGLPDMNGAEIIANIRRIQPDLRCFLVTGYSAEDVARHGVDTGAADIMTKPVDPDELTRRLGLI